MQNYRLFTCPECGHTFSVAESSAGETLPCPGCQKSITLPTLGALRSLPVPPTPVEAPHKERNITEMDRRIGVMFLLGAIALTFFILAAYYGYQYYYYYNYIYSIKYEDWTIVDTWNKWQFLRPGVDTPLTENEQNSLYYLRLMWKWLVIYMSFVVVCVAGIVLLWIKPIRKVNEQPDSNIQ